MRIDLSEITCYEEEVETFTVVIDGKEITSKAFNAVQHDLDENDNCIRCGKHFNRAKAFQPLLKIKRRMGRSIQQSN